MVSRNDVLNYVYETYGTKSEHLWEKHPTYEVLRHKKNSKWYGIIMDIPGQKVGLDNAEPITILVIKSEPEIISLLVGQNGFAPAYHMNKTHWLTILLDGTLKDEQIYNLLDMSYEMTKN